MKRIRFQPPEQKEKTAPASVLVIDDSPTICKIMEMTHTLAGYRVNTFLDGVSAFSWLTQSKADVPDLVFVDVHLPKPDGYQVVQRLKSNRAFAEVEVVMMSGSDGRIARLKARLCGGRDPLLKPFTTEQLFSLTQPYLRREGQGSEPLTSRGQQDR